MRVVLTGASGQLGAYLLPRLARRGDDVFGWTGRTTGNRSGIAFRPVELSDRDALQAALTEADPELILHAGALSAAEAVRLDPRRGATVNVEATKQLCNWAQKNQRRLIFTSTDLVFDGSQAWNKEDDPAEPLLAYGRTKREAEPFVLGWEGGLVARLSLLYGPTLCGHPGFFDKAVEALRQGTRQSFFNDEYRTPLALSAAADALIGLIDGDFRGMVHVAGAERMSRFELMIRVAQTLKLDPNLVGSNRLSDAQLAEPRPADVSLDTSQLRSWLPAWQAPTIEEALVGFVHQS